VSNVTLHNAMKSPDWLCVSGDHCCAKGRDVIPQIVENLTRDTERALCFRAMPRMRLGSSRRRGRSRCALHGRTDLSGPARPAAYPLCQPWCAGY
jgi:hypothetical protein